MISFSQIWSDTATGFGGMAGQSMTHAQTVVFMRGHHYIVCINGRFAYFIASADQNFREDLARRQLAGATDYKCYLDARRDLIKS